MQSLEHATVYKSNSLVEAAYRLTVVEQRLVLACISQVPRGQPITDQVMYSVTALDIAELSDTDPKSSYRELQEAALRLKRREVRIERETNGNRKRKKVLICGWVQTIEYVEAEGRVNLRFNKDMLPYLTELSAQFTKYRLAAVAKMNSAHAIRFYELLSQWRDVGKREVAVAWLREIFMLGDKYPAIKDFKKWVIDAAVAQINEHSDLIVSYEQRKSGRIVSHLIFTFAPKKAPAQLPANPEETFAKAQANQAPARAKPPTQVIREGELFQRLREIGIGERLALSWIKQDEIRTKAALEYTEARAAQGFIRGSKAGYVRRVIEEGSKTDLSPPPSPKLTRKEIKRLARPGETWEQAEIRIGREKDRQRRSVLVSEQPTPSG